MKEWIKKLIKKFNITSTKKHFICGLAAGFVLFLVCLQYGFSETFYRMCYFMAGAFIGIEAFQLINGWINRKRYYNWFMAIIKTIKFQIVDSIVDIIAETIACAGLFVILIHLYISFGG
jgi:hypothetical protein